MGRKKVFVAQSVISAPAEEVFRWHAEPGALERLTPPWEPMEVLQPAPGIRNGDRGVLRVRVGPLRVRWEFEHRECVDGRQFRDVQIRGPFRRWDHTHRMMPEGANTCRLEDRVEYELPLGFIGSFLGGWLVDKKLRKLFRYRHNVTAEALTDRATKKGVSPEVA
jgi:hypothetical protein